MATEPKKLTPTQALKEAQAEIDRLGKALIKLNEHAAKEQADYGNGQYTLGYQEGIRDGLAQADAAAKAQSYITRLLKR